MTRLPLLMALLGLWPLLGVSSCDSVGSACTEIGCSDSVTLTLTDNGAIPQGLLTLAVTIDGTTETCTMTVDASEVHSGSCPAYVRSSGGTRPSGGRTTRWLEVAFPISAGGDAPDVSVRVQQAGEVRFDGVVGLDLEAHTPNGIDCPPTCRRYRAGVPLL